MRAIQIVEPRKIVMLDDAPGPEPAEGEVLVRCTHVGLCGSNTSQYMGLGFWSGGRFPLPPAWSGHENVGIIVESRCDQWKEGELVLALPVGSYGFAEYIVARPPGIARLPKDAADPAAFVVAQPLATVLRALTRTGVVVNQSCAVVGQGPMGLIFTHVLRLMGAATVIAADLLGWRLEWSRRYGADHVVDSSTTDTIKAIEELTDGRMVDLAIEAVGDVDALKTTAHLPKHGGRLLVFGVPHHEYQEFPWHRIFQEEIQINTSVGPRNAEFFQIAADMVIDDRASALSDMVTPRMPWDKAPEAFEMYATCAKGSLKLVLEL